MARIARTRRRGPLGPAYRLAVAILWPFMRTMVKWETEGTERLAEDDGGVIVAVNHTSWFDPLVVAFALWEADRPPRFLGKDSLFKVPVIGRIITAAGQIPVYRDRADASSAIRDALAALDRGECVVVYPEGTVTRDPNLWPMTGKTGAVRLALESGRPVYPMVQWGSHLVMRPYVREFRILPRKPVRIAVGDPVDFGDLRGMAIDAGLLTKGTDRLMDAITALEARVRQEAAPAERVTFTRPDRSPHAQRSAGTP